MKKLSLLAAALVCSAVTFAQTTAPTATKAAAQVKHADEKAIRKDIKDEHADKKDLVKDVKAGDKADAKKDIADIKADKKDMKQDVKQARRDGVKHPIRRAVK